MKLKSILLIVFFQTTEAFNCINVSNKRSSLNLLATPQSRGDFLEKVLVASLTSTLIFQEPVGAIDSQSIIQPCKVRRSANCVSTASVKQLECYVAPWTFEVSASEAQKTLRTFFIADPDIYEAIYEEKNYIRVNAIRGLAKDRLEFLFDEEEKFVKIRSSEISETPSMSDFGANRRRLDEIRKVVNIFDVMGGGGYDSIETRGTGPLGQLKSFYGLQSGAGFEDVLKEM
mmetsp:Transcript_30486/g.34748  ORF Transcript_30486/g.34748 Transcript_30486/m.34748 type:complete len:230 (-) Transcript_30486:286-975(-)|eukprot:CAMPEP_0194137130 /NCGR_PEP_ID=MMETSP0152-20130528/7057_1 /TAXON_ID=1049557 /ORGANISM="Thalassiothrix antarctica, Strain L6-D1" /LENGTH=229 /DNA_ID=CAMNT_0038834025 /DNA_START=26 /DNA_END=715 /DNA_ORIENTATION=-